MPARSEDEPVFLLRAQDRFAPNVVEFWAEHVEAMTRGNLGENIEKTKAKLAEARAIAHEMRAWQERTGRAKVPD